MKVSVSIDIDVDKYREEYGVDYPPGIIRERVQSDLKEMATNHFGEILGVLK